MDDTNNTNSSKPQPKKLHRPASRTVFNSKDSDRAAVKKASKAKVERSSKKQLQCTERQERALREQFARAAEILNSATEPNRVLLLPVLLQEIESIRSLLRHMVHNKLTAEQIEELKLPSDKSKPRESKILTSDRVPVGKGFVHRSQGQTKKPGSSDQ